MTIPVRPMLAVPSNGKRGKVITIAELTGTHTFELKVDGIRGMVQWDGTDVTIWNRNGVVITNFFPEVRDGFRKANLAPFLLDGELDLVDPGASFNDLCVRTKGSEARAAKLSTTHPAWFVGFDLLQYGDGDVWITEPYHVRRAGLESLRDVLGAVPWFTLTPTSPDGQKFWDLVHGQGLEGLIAKRDNARYQPGRRSADWVKFKTTRRLTCVAVGYEPGEGSRSHFGAMHIAVVGDKPQYVGRVGTGFNDSDIAWLKSRLDAGQMPLVEIECLGRTRDNKLRFPVYIGPRTDLTLLDAGIDQLDDLPLQ